MMNKDDQDWVALVGGESAPDASAGTRQEAMRLRATVRAAREQVAARSETIDVDVDAAWQRLSARAEQAGLRAPAATSTSTGGAGEPRRRAAKRWPALLATLGAGVAAMIYIGLQPALVGMRGGETYHLPAMQVDDPGEEARSLAQELQAAGATIVGQKIDADNGTASLTVDLGELGEPGDAVDAVLGRHNVPNTPQKTFVIELQRRAP